MTSPSLSCDEVEALLPLVADGTLDEVADPTLFIHLAECERCQQSMVTHDLIAISLPRASRLPEPRRLRTWWHRVLPVAAAASLLMGGGWFVIASRETASGPIPTVSLAKKDAVVPQPKSLPPNSLPPKPAILLEPVEIEVVALPGSTAAHPQYLVRRGEQVLLVAPQVAPTQAPSDARPASYTPNRY